jgi:hypothetical protein
VSEDLRTEPDTVALSAAWRVEQVCKDFEAAWRDVAQFAQAAGGPRPRIEDYLVRAGEPERLPLARELILLEVYYRRQICKAFATQNEGKGRRNRFGPKRFLPTSASDYGPSRGVPVVRP